MPFIMLQGAAARCSECPTWTHPQINNSKECTCGSEANYIVKCDNITKEVYVMDCYLITYDKKVHRTLVGASIYGCSQNEGNHRNDSVYHKVSKDVHKLDVTECTPLNRMGRLCGACSPNHYPLIYSYKLNCIPCNRRKLNWLIYTARAFIPLTLLIFTCLWFCLNSAHTFQVYMLVSYSVNCCRHQFLSELGIENYKAQRWKHLSTLPQHCMECGT